jgi:branched-chain amino acid transport system permease protein
MNLELLADSLAGSVVLAGTYTLIGLSWVIVFRASQLMNFSTGQFLVLAGFIAASMLGAGWNYWLTLLIVLIGMALLGVLMYRFILRPLAGRELFAPVMATLGVSIILQGVMQIIWGPHSLGITPPFPNTVLHLPLHITTTVYNVIVPGIALVFWLGTILFLRRTKFGGQMRAANESALLASQSGMNVYVIFGVAFAISFMALAFAGITYGQQSLVAQTAIPIGLAGLVPAMLGGLSSVGGVVIGALIVSVAQNLTTLFLGADWSQLTVYVILLIVLAVRPNGLFGNAEVQRV